MRKGFTLVELLGVIIVLALICLITIPAITDSLNKYKKDLCQTQISYMISAAKNWGIDHMLQLPEGEEKVKIKLSQLIQEGYMQGDKNAVEEENRLKVINPNTKEYFNPDPIITIQKQGKRYTYTMDEETINSCKKTTKGETEENE